MEPIFGRRHQSEEEIEYCSACGNAYLSSFLRQYKDEYICMKCWPPLQETRPYCVVGFFSDNKQPFTCPVSAASPLAAAGAAVRSMLDLNAWDDDRADEIVIVAVLGHNPGADIVVAYDQAEITKGEKFFLPPVKSHNLRDDDILASTPSIDCGSILSNVY